MAAAIEVQRLGVEDVALARETIRAIKTHDDTSEDRSLDSTDMQAWLSRSSNVLMTASINGIPIGFALGYFLDRADAAGAMLFFYEIEVAVAYRRGGIGRRLVEMMKDLAREKDVLKMWVQTSPDNTAARALYQSAGGMESQELDLHYVWTSRNNGVLGNLPAGAKHPNR